VRALLLSPVKQGDSGWYLFVAKRGYDMPRPSVTAFFPMYPLLVRIVEAPIGSFEVARAVVSLDWPRGG
jgi:hypothetical protein